MGWGQDLGLGPERLGLESAVSSRSDLLLIPLFQPNLLHSFPMRMKWDNLPGRCHEILRGKAVYTRDWSMITMFDFWSL